MEELWLLAQAHQREMRDYVVDTPKSISDKETMNEFRRFLRARAAKRNCLEELSRDAILQSSS